MAAGLSSRMGKDKLMLEIAGKRVIDYVTAAVDGANFYEKIIVTKDKALHLPNQNWIMAANPKFASGQSSSVAIGTKFASEDTDALMFLPADMPALESRHLSALMDFFAAEPYNIARPVYMGNPCSPVIFPKSFRDELMNLTGDTGGRPILRAHFNEIRHMPAAEEAYSLDMDSEEDYINMKKYMEMRIKNVGS